MNASASNQMGVYTPLADGFFPLLREHARTASIFTPGSREDVRRVLGKAALSAEDFLLLLSPVAGEELESMAERAQKETLRHFGFARQLFAPLYLGNYCTNRCVYCGFHAGQGIKRTVLSEEAIKAEAEALAATGLRRVLALTGDAPKRTGPAYIAAAVEILSGYFPSVGIEVQALTREEYSAVALAGADSMVMFQETYDPALYARVHPSGPKRDFAFRLDAPDRAARAGMRGITLGALLGLGDWRFDMFMLGMHGQWMQRRYPHLELSFSLPRLRPSVKENSGEKLSSHEERKCFEPRPVHDRDFVQAMTALRCFLPHAGITLSTRERAFLRDKLLPLGVTRISAGVSTSVGGYARPEENNDPVQFVIDDGRSVARMAEDMRRLGFQPVFADWLLPKDGDLPLAGALMHALAPQAER